MDERGQFQEVIGSVSRETLTRLDRYAELLTEWNQKFNLVSKSTIPHVWSRHFLDSAQLFKHIPNTAKSLADLGSGAGFPGLVLSILGVPKTHLIESIGKKANFLRAVIEELKLDAEVHQTRVEDLKDFKADVVTARALQPLPELLNLSNSLMNKDSVCLFLKGQNASVELTESAKYWKFACEKIQSLSDPSGCVLIIKDLHNHGAARKHKPSRRR